MTEDRKKIREQLIVKAEFFKTLSHPARLCILRLLLEKGQSKVSDMQCCLEISQSNVSQHVAKLKSAGILAGNREGTEIYYYIKEEYRTILALVLKEIL